MHPPKITQILVLFITLHRGRAFPQAFAERCVFSQGIAV